MSPGSPSRPPAVSRPGRALRRKALGGSTGDGSEAVVDDPDSADPDLPRAVIDPRAVQFREALSAIPDLEHDEIPPEAPEPPPTSTSQQVIDLDAIPAEPRLPNTAEVDLAARLKQVPDGTPLPAVSTRLARPRRAVDKADASREAESESPGDEGPTTQEAEEGSDIGSDGQEVVDLGPAAELVPPIDLEAVGHPRVDNDEEPPSGDDREPEGEADVAVVLPPEPAAVRSARTRTGPKHSKPKAKVRRTTTSIPPRPPWWRRAGFAVILAALVVAVPVLFVAGYRTVTRSTDGRLQTSSLTREDPGFEELVTSTPTAVLTQLDAEGVPIGHTLLSLANNDGGGAVVFIPLDTELAEPAFGVGTLRTVVTMSQRPPSDVRAGVVPQIAKLVNVQIDETFELDDAGLTQIMAPVGPLDIHNPEPVEAQGVPFEAGPLTLQPDQIGPYLGAERWGENQLNQFVRQEEVWKAWLGQVAASPDPGVVPGESDAGIGWFIRTLASGPVAYITLPGEFGDDGLYRTDEAALREMVVDHIPVPAPPRPGDRTTIRLLNGVEPADPPVDVIRELVANRGSISVVGNASSFDRDVTDIVYSDPEMEPVATYLATVLDIGGDTHLEPTSSDAVDLTIILGRDLYEPLGGF